MSITEKQLAAHLIDKYRELIIIRYDYDELIKRLNLDSRLTRNDIDNLCNYFIDYIYPNAEKREQIEKAFKTLSAFISKPLKIWRLLGNMAKAVFKFGRLFPVALSAGFKSLQSYIDAKGFEKNLLIAVKEFKLQYPLSNKDFERCLVNLPRKDVEKFVEEVYSLLNYITNDKLVKITIEIMDNIIEKMNMYPHVYTVDEINGIKLGRAILQNGYDLFYDMDSEVKQLVLEFIKQNEFWFLDEIYANGYF
jgi:hypothetical protein